MGRSLDMTRLNLHSRELIRGGVDSAKSRPEEVFELLVELEVIIVSIFIVGYLLDLRA